MNIKVEKVMLLEDNRRVQVGDVVTIHYYNGGGAGGCKITKITDKGFHFNQGKGRDKSISFENLKSIECNI